MTPRAIEPFCDWDHVPLWCRIEDFARVRNVSTATIRREIKTGTCRPMPAPKTGKSSPHLWSRIEIEKHWRTQPREVSKGSPRRYFGKARQTAA